MTTAIEERLLYELDVARQMVTILRAENAALKQRIEALESGVDAEGLIKIGFRAKPETFTEAERALIYTLSMQTAQLIAPYKLNMDVIDTAHSKIMVDYDKQGRATRARVTLNAAFYYDEPAPEPQS